MAFETLIPHRILVCVDCYLTYHDAYGDDEASPDRVPLSEIGDGVHLTTGMLAEYHQCGRAVNEIVAGCTCERIEFSTEWCDGCGSTLAGTREYMTVWLPND
jgi:hypothetical protein